VAATAGIVLGFAVALFSRGHEIVTLAAVAVGSALAGFLMAVTGHALGPEDPRPQAAGQPDFTAQVIDCMKRKPSGLWQFPWRCRNSLYLASVANS